MKKVYLPTNMFKSIQNHAKTHKEELCGVFLYLQNSEEDKIICANYPMTEGSSGHVKPLDKNIKIFNVLMDELYEQGKDIGYIWYHTHSKGTIDNYVEHYAYYFSESDKVEFASQQSEDPTFTSMLITPKHKRILPEHEIIFLEPGNSLLNTIKKNQNRIIDLENIIS